MTNRSNRRTFLQTTTAAGVGYWVAGGVSKAASLSANEEIRFASIGVGGKGTSDSNDASQHGKMVGICDIDDKNLGKAGERFNGAKKYNDYRKMLDELEKSIDAVTVSTPDHSHAPASAMAIRLGKHCFTQKPMTHTIFEARTLSNLAKEHNVQTMMGNQGTASSILRKSAALIQAGFIGKIKEVHVWTNRPVWPQNISRPTETQEVPKHIHWKEFIGPAKMRPYNEAYHPFKWRGWWDFGTGALGDMACHTLNMPFAALNLRDPLSVQAETSGHNGETFPGNSTIVYDFPAIGDRAAVKMTWYDGGKKPPRKLLPKRSQIVDKNGKELVRDGRAYARLIERGSLLVGEKGTLFSPGDYGFDRNCGYLIDGEYTLQRDVKEPSVEFKASPGHFAEYARAIKEGIPAMSNFQTYAGPLTEVVLLGNLAVWADGKKIEWDAKNMKATNAPEVQHIVNKEYHNGYKL